MKLHIEGGYQVQLIEQQRTTAKEVATDDAATKVLQGLSTRGSGVLNINRIE
jgi:hypothetical protein